MFGLRSRKNRNTANQMYKSKPRKTCIKTSKHRNLTPKENPQVVARSPRVTIPYNYLGDAVTSATVYRNHTGKNTEKENSTPRAEAIPTEDPQCFEERSQFKSVSDYYAKLQTSQPSNKGSIFKEIETEYQKITNSQPNFCEPLNKLVWLRKACKSRFTSSISNIKHLINNVDNEVVPEDCEVSVEVDDDQYAQVPLLCPPEQWVNNTPRNRPTAYPIVESTIHNPCAFPNWGAFPNQFQYVPPFAIPQDAFSNGTSNNFLTFNNNNHRTGIFNIGPEYEMQSKHNPAILFNSSNPRPNSRNPEYETQSNHSSAISFNASSFGTAKTLNDSDLKLNESFLVPAVPELREPSPLKFYPRRIFTQDF